MFHFIFDYNYGNFWQILIIFLPQEAGMNTLPNVYKLFHFNLTMSPLYVVKLKRHKNSRPLVQCILLNWLFQTFGESRSMFVSFRIC